MRPREVKLLAQGHPARKCLGWDSNLADLLQSVGFRPPGTAASVSERKCSGSFNRREKELAGKLRWGLKVPLAEGPGHYFLH